MQIANTFSAGRMGLQRAEHGLQRNADAVARRSGNLDASQSLQTALIEANSHKQEAEAAAKLIAAADETLGTVLDTLA